MVTWDQDSLPYNKCNEAEVRKVAVLLIIYILLVISKIYYWKPTEQTGDIFLFPLDNDFFTLVLVYIRKE